MGYVRKLSEHTTRKKQRLSNKNKTVTKQNILSFQSVEHFDLTTSKSLLGL